MQYLKKKELLDSKIYKKEELKNFIEYQKLKKRNQKKKKYFLMKIYMF